MKKAFVAISLIINFSLYPIHATESPINSSEQTIHQTLKNFDGNDLVACINLIQATIQNYYENYEDQEENSPEWSLWTKSFLEVYLHSLIVTICHELGHAAAAKLLAHSPVDIHLGSYEHSAHALIQTNSFTLESLNPYIGYAQVDQTDSTGKNAFILLAGGTSGLMAHFILKAIKIFFGTYKNQPRLTTSFKIKKSLQDSFTKVSTLDFIAGVQLANILIPMGNSSDAAKLWRLVGISGHVVDTIGQAGPYVAGLLIGTFIHLARQHQR